MYKYFDKNTGQWLVVPLMRGPQGYPGASGKDGADGKDGANGKDGVDGKNGADGSDGSDGLTYKNIIIYKHSETSVNNPVGGSWNSDTNVAIIPEGWTTDSDLTPPVYMSQRTFCSDSNLSDNSWTTPVKITGSDGDSSFKSYVFTRSNDKPSVPTGGTYDNPMPNEIRWTDGVPEGDKILWTSVKTFSTDSTKEIDWSDPVQLTDTSNFEVIYGIEGANLTQLPSLPLVEGLTNYNGWYDNDADVSGEIWYMATATCKNGEWSSWSVSKIKGEKGEKGEDGSSVYIEGKFDTLSSLKEAWQLYINGDSSKFVGTLDPGDGYFVEETGYLYIYSGGWTSEDDDSEFEYYWVSVELKGEPGTSAKIEVRFSNDCESFTGNSGKDPGRYIGIYYYTSDDNPDLENPELYPWSLWSGEDGWGYEQWFILSDGIPELPNVSLSDEWKETWHDDPQEPTPEMDCWAIYRTVKGGQQEFGEFKGPIKYASYIENPHTLILYNPTDQIYVDGENKAIIDQTVSTKIAYKIGNTLQTLTDDIVSVNSNGLPENTTATYSNGILSYTVNKGTEIDSTISEIVIPITVNETETDNFIIKILPGVISYDLQVDKICYKTGDTFEVSIIKTDLVAGTTEAIELTSDILETNLAISGGSITSTDGSIDGNIAIYSTNGIEENITITLSNAICGVICSDQAIIYWIKDGVDAVSEFIELSNEFDQYFVVDGALYGGKQTFITNLSFYSNGNFKTIDPKDIIVDYDDDIVTIDLPADSSTSIQISVTVNSDPGSDISIPIIYRDHTKNITLKRIVGIDDYDIWTSAGYVKKSVNGEYSPDSVTVKIKHRVLGVNGSDEFLTVVPEGYTLYYGNSVEMVGGDAISQLEDFPNTIRLQKGTEIIDETTIEVIEDGATGDTGASGKMLYPAGVWDSATEYRQSGNAAPYVEREYNNSEGNLVKDYFILIGESSTGEEPESYNEVWEKGSSFSSVLTEAIVAQYGIIGGAVYYEHKGTNLKFLISSQGYTVTNSDDTTKLTPSTEYIYFCKAIGDDVTSIALNADSTLLDTIYTTSKFIPNVLICFTTGDSWFSAGNIKMYSNSTVENAGFSKTNITGWSVPNSMSFDFEEPDSGEYCEFYYYNPIVIDTYVRYQVSILKRGVKANNVRVYLTTGSDTSYWSSQYINESGTAQITLPTDQTVTATVDIEYILDNTTLTFADGGGTTRTYTLAISFIDPNDSGDQEYSWPQFIYRSSDVTSVKEGLYVDGDITYTGNLISTSDERLKSFKDPVVVDLDKLHAVKKAYFTFNESPDKLEVGVSAQEINNLYPELVNNVKDGYLGVDYSKLSVIALKAIDILYEKNQELEARLSVLETKLNS